MAEVEEIRGVTWDLWGHELSHEQAIQRIVNAGFPVQGGVALTMFAIVEGESGEYQQAWHINVLRNPDGTITRDPSSSMMVVKSIDLGFFQFNISVDPNSPLLDGPGGWLTMTSERVAQFVEAMFDAHPDLADPVQSAARAYTLWKTRGFQPWYAYQPGTLRFWQKKRYGALAFARWHLHSFVGGTDRETGAKLDFKWVGP